MVVTRSQSKKMKTEAERKEFVVIYSKERNEDGSKRAKLKKIAQAGAIILMSALYFEPRIQSHMNTHGELYGYMYCAMLQMSVSGEKIKRYAGVYGLLYVLNGYGFPIEEQMTNLISPLNTVQRCVLFTGYVMIPSMMLEHLQMILSMMTIVITTAYVTMVC